MSTTNPSTAQIGEEFIRQQVAGTPITLKDLAVRYGRSYTALRKAASDGGWSSRAALANVERDTAIAEKVAQTNALTASLLDEAIGREVDVRLRHAMLARSLQRMALERLVALNPSELSAKLAVEMLKVGVDGERVALGLGNAGPNLCDQGDNNSRVREAVQEAMVILDRHARSLAPESVPDDEKAGHRTTTAPPSPVEGVASYCNQLQ